MSVKHFKQFYIGRYYGNKIAFVFSVKFCRAQFAQFCKNAVSDNGKQFKGYKVIAVLFGIVKYPAQHGSADKCVCQ